MSEEKKDFPTGPHRADWLKEAKWGVWCHYLTNEQSPQKNDTTAEAWNALVDGFDVEALAEQLKECHVPYFIFTIGQGSGHYCAPNAAYDEITGITPSRCSRRDLMGDLADALIARDIRLIAYAPSDGPWSDPVARVKFEKPTSEQWLSAKDDHAEARRQSAFQKKWERVLAEWSTLWGERVSGWWIDGCYTTDQMYRHEEEPNFKSFAAALRAGNPEAIIAFNPGIHIEHTDPEEDYTAGECDYHFPMGPGQFMDGRWVEDKRSGHYAQLHVSSFLGPYWCQSPPRFSDEFAIAYTKHVVDAGGAITWDVPINNDGSLPAAFVAQLSSIGKNIVQDDKEINAR